VTSSTSSSRGRRARHCQKSCTVLPARSWWAVDVELLYTWVHARLSRQLHRIREHPHPTSGPSVSRQCKPQNCNPESASCWLILKRLAVEADLPPLTITLAAVIFSTRTCRNYQDPRLPQGLEVDQGLCEAPRRHCWAPAREHSTRKTGRMCPQSCGTKAASGSGDPSSRCPRTGRPCKSQWRTASLPRRSPQRHLD